eukprot:scaffold226938_cov14-Tisochrysis_lutea.AAC.1
MLELPCFLLTRISTQGNKAPALQGVPKGSETVSRREGRTPFQINALSSARLQIGLKRDAN